MLASELPFRSQRGRNRRAAGCMSGHQRGRGWHSSLSTSPPTIRAPGRSRGSTSSRWIQFYQSLPQCVPDPPSITRERVTSENSRPTQPHETDTLGRYPTRPWAFLIQTWVCPPPAQGPEAMDTHVVGGSLLPVHGPCDIHPARHGVDAEDLHRGLVGAHARDAVADGDVAVFVGPDLEGGAGGGEGQAAV